MRAELLHPWALFPQLFPSLLRWCNPQATQSGPHASCFQATYLGKGISSHLAQPKAWITLKDNLGLHARSDPVTVTEAGERTFI